MSNQYKHTKGPWFVWNEHVHAGKPEKKTKSLLLGAVPRICDIDFDDVDVPRRAAKANARLIAAAPELLAALASIVEMNPELPMGMMEAAKAAVTKATGEAA